MLFVTGVSVVRARFRGGLLCALLLSWLLPVTARAEACNVPPWPLWQTFVEHFVQPDGRVMDASTPQRHSSSEGQSYAMFFALVADDRETFEKLWRWSVNNLAQGDIKTHLPGWFWGLDEHGEWVLLDSNSASDGDLWFAYALLEAGRLWHRMDYTEDGRHLLHNIAAQEVASLPGLGKMLLPGKFGFIKPDPASPDQWQLNPSYMPIPILRRFAEVDPKGPWADIAKNTATLIKAVSHNGFVADWVTYRATGTKTGEFVTDPTKGDLGSYDAIRTCMWAGLMPARDRLRKSAFHRSVINGEMFNPISAVDAGFLDQVVKPEELHATALEVARQLKKINMKAHKNTKLKVRKELLETLDKAIELDQHHAL